MTNMSSRDQHGLEMGVYVTRAKTGKKEGVVAEEQLEAYGWGTDPLGALQRWQATMSCHCDEGFLAYEPDEFDITNPNCARCSGWPDDVKVSVRTDEDSHYPTFTYVFSAEIGVKSTRPQRVLRELATYFMNLANGLDTNPGFTGKYELNRLDDTQEEN